MSFQFIENLYQTKLSSSNFLRERTISSMDCKEYKQKIFPETPRIKPQQTPDILIQELVLPPITEEISEEDMNAERTCQFSLNEQQPEIIEETSTENDSVMNLSSPLSGTPKKFKSKLFMKKYKSFKLEQQNRNRAASVALPRFSIYTFLKKIIRKQKHNKF